MLPLLPPHALCVNMPHFSFKKDGDRQTVWGGCRGPFSPSQLPTCYTLLSPRMNNVCVCYILFSRDRDLDRDLDTLLPLPPCLMPTPPARRGAGWTDIADRQAAGWQCWLRRLVRHVSILLSSSQSVSLSPSPFYHHHPTPTPTFSCFGVVAWRGVVLLCSAILVLCILDVLSCCCCSLSLFSVCRCGFKSAVW